MNELYPILLCRPPLWVFNDFSEIGADWGRKKSLLGVHSGRNCHLCGHPNMRTLEAENARSWDRSKLRALKVESARSWDRLKLRTLETETAWSWERLKLRSLEAENAWSWERLKLRTLEAENARSWERSKLRRYLDVLFTSNFFHCGVWISLLA